MNQLPSPVSQTSLLLVAYSIGSLFSLSDMESAGAGEDKVYSPETMEHYRNNSSGKGRDRGGWDRIRSDCFADSSSHTE